MEAEDFDGLDEWIHAEVIEPLNTYSVDQHKLDVPAASDPAPADENKHITRRELASVLHGLRLMQEQWEPQMHGCTSIGLHDPLELSEPNSCDHFCDEGGFSARPQRDRRALRKAQHRVLQLTGSWYRAR